MTDIALEMTAKRYNNRMGFQDSLNEVRKKERMTEGNECEVHVFEMSSKCSQSV
jgi:hypothetical protein